VTLIRRVTSDLTGLPPTLGEIDEFLANGEPDAYEQLVDRLLASPRFGERMALPWLYAARYADTSGYQNDGPRSMWRWRDWVIDAFNSNKPFDEFTIEQIAGDLLPRPTLDQRIATGFNRNHRGNAEGGIIPEEYAAEYVVDRVETTSTVFLGLTLGCARCHDHKYDPFSQVDFYRLFAYFNNVPEFGRAIKEGNSPPYIQAPTPQDVVKLRSLDAAIDDATQKFADWQPRLAAAQAEWEKTVDRAAAIDWAPTEQLVAHFKFDGDAALDGQASPAPFFEGEPAFRSGRIGQAAHFDGSRCVDAGDLAGFGYFDKFSFGAWVFPDGNHGGTVLSRMTELEQGEGYGLQVSSGRFQVNLVKRWLDDAIRVETERVFEPDRWYHVFATYDGSRHARGVTIYVDGVAEPCRVNLDFINQTFATKDPLRVGGGGGAHARFCGLIDDARVFGRCLTADDVQFLATVESISEIAAIPPERRTEQQALKLARCFLENYGPPEANELFRNMIRLQREREHMVENIPTVMVMEEMPQPRDTHVLLRGAYDKPGERVTPGVPTTLSAGLSIATDDRLGLAHWLVDPANPLTARVVVNRLWQMVFGIGLVKTTEDFGTQGDLPTHPELLDWLAVQFASGPAKGDMKALLKQIVTSAIYRQSSKLQPDSLSRDAENRLMSRGPRVRLSAEAIRDQVLAASGLLVERVGGPSVKPYQPAGLWKEIATDGDYVQDHGENLYRRSLYTYWKRTVAPPAMTNFDATAREACSVRETRTNTPLQALTLLNEISFVEASRRLAERVMIEGGQRAEDRVRFAFRLVTSRWPRPAELEVLTNALAEYQDHFRHDPEAAAQLIANGESPSDTKLNTADLAAYATLASLLLNLDEVVTKQ
jgi:hypothetical protein